MSVDITEKFSMIGNEILNTSRNELYMNMRFLDLALSSLSYDMTDAIDGVGTDGFRILYEPKYLIDLYQKDRILVNRVYLHLVFHCVFRHLLKRGKREENYWNLACDISIEALIDGLNHRSIRKSRSLIRRDLYLELQKRLKVLTAEGIYEALYEMELSLPMIRRLHAEFRMDDHSYWLPPQDENQPPPPQVQQLQDKWKDISEKMETEMETFSKEASQGAGELLEELKVENRERYDYKAFLRKFSVLQEEMQVDSDSFDYIFYSYGLRLYGNVPLIEPQEFKEVTKIQDFVIVIDTSMSCSGDLIKTFLEQTYSVLRESESYFKKVRIHIIQCDEKVESDELITCEEDLKQYMEHFQLFGNGGTDFRPAFAYVDKLIEENAFTRLKGMLYFTDGFGIFPKKRPVYDTAFVFMEEDYNDAGVPPWAMKLVIEKEQLEKEKKLRIDYTFV